LTHKSAQRETNSAMKPRDVLNFFKTRSGKLLLFAAVFGGGLLLFSTLRERSGSGKTDLRVGQLTTNATDKPQVVQSIERPMQPFRPPAPKPEPPPAPSKTNEPPKVLVEKPKPEPPPPLALVDNRKLRRKFRAPLELAHDRIERDPRAGDT